MKLEGSGRNKGAAGVGVVNAVAAVKVNRNSTTQARGPGGAHNWDLSKQ